MAPADDVAARAACYHRHQAAGLLLPMDGPEPPVPSWHRPRPALRWWRVVGEILALGVLAGTALAVPVAGVLLLLR